MKCPQSSSDRILGEKNGEVYKAKYWFAKKIFEKSQTVRLGGGGVRCHSTICEIAGFSHGFCLFSIVSPYEYFSHSFKWKKTSVRSFCRYDLELYVENKNWLALRVFVQNAEKNAQCHFSRAGSKGTGWNFRILGYTTSALCWAHNELCLQARAWFTKYAHHIILCLSDTSFDCAVASSRQNSLLEISIPMSPVARGLQKAHYICQKHVFKFTITKNPFAMPCMFFTFANDLLTPSLMGVWGRRPKTPPAPQHQLPLSEAGRPNWGRRPNTPARNHRWVRCSIPRGSPTWVPPIYMVR